jgi:hypothetical protein
MCASLASRPYTLLHVITSVVQVSQMARNPLGLSGCSLIT